MYIPLPLFVHHFISKLKFQEAQSTEIKIKCSWIEYIHWFDHYLQSILM